MAEHRDRLRLHVVGENVRAPAYRGMGLRRAIQRERRSRTRAEVDAVDAPRSPHDLDGIPAHRVAHAHGAHLVAQLCDLGRAQDRLERLGTNVGGSVDPQNSVLIVRVGVSEIQKEEKSIELGLGQRKGALELHRVLRRDDDERIGERMRRLVDGHLALLHRLEQRRLRARGGAVYLVDEDDVRRQGAGPVLESLGALVVDGDPGYVARHQVRRALNTPEREVERACDRAGESGLPHPGHVIEQDVALNEKRAEELLRHLALPDHDRGDVFDEALGRALNGERHPRTMRPPVSTRRRGSTRSHRGSRPPSRARERGSRTHPVHAGRARSGPARARRRA